MGIFRGTKLEDRLCLPCKIQVMEDEFHFECECNVYVN